VYDFLLVFFSNFVPKTHRFYPRDVVSVVLVHATATYLAGWVGGTRRYCIKTPKFILKLFYT